MKGSLRIIKTSSDKKIEGFSFRVTGENGYDEIFKTDKNGEILIEGLRIGKYIISEVNNDASAGYMLPDDKVVEIEYGKTANVEMHNEKIHTPKQVTRAIQTSGLFSEAHRQLVLRLVRELL